MSKIWITRGELRTLVREMVEGPLQLCEDCGMPMDACECDMHEDAPPGREKQVKRLKKVPGIDNPWAVSWASYNKSHGKGKK